MAGSVTQTVFDGFTLAQRQRAAEAGWHQAAKQYQSTVVTAFQNVADVLQAIQLDAESVNTATKAADAARHSLCLHVAAFVGYYGTSGPKSHTPSGPRSAKLLFADRDHQPLVQRYFGDWWENVCGSYRHYMTELQAQRPTAQDQPEDSKKFKDSADRPSGIDVLTAEQVYLAARLSLVTAKATQRADVVALFQALGGGWWNRSDVAGGDDRGLALSHP
jgi:Outer membrane efflux protein